MYASVHEIEQFKCNFGKYPARLPDTWEPYSLATGRIIAITCTWDNGMIFNWYYDINSSTNIMYYVSDSGSCELLKMIPVCTIRAKHI